MPAGPNHDGLLDLLGTLVALARGDFFEDEMPGLRATIKRCSASASPRMVL